MSERPKGYNPENEKPLEFGIVEGSKGRTVLVATLKGLNQLTKMYRLDTPIKKGNCQYLAQKLV